jgi:hypothetical protein
MITYVTSFNKELYKASGKLLVQSFNKHNNKDQLLVTYEGFKFSEPHKRIKSFDITNHTLLQQFFEINKDVIPGSLGGNSKPCKCSKRAHSKKFGKDNICHNTWFNRNAFRYFRKFVALNYALSKARDNDKLIWLDSDCHFVKHVYKKFILALFNGTDNFYIKGPRPIDESGIFGLNVCIDTRNFIYKIITNYLDKSFREQIRWDDSSQLMTSRKKRFSTNDIHPNIKELRKNIVHTKGIHGRAGLMK